MVRIHPKAKILKSLSHELLWDNFLCSTANSFVISTSEAQALLGASLKPDIAATEQGAAGGGGADAAASSSQASIDAYIELLKETTIHHEPVPVDFMALCSSVLLLSDSPLEMKLDQIFEWITMGEKDYIEFNEMYVAVSSFELGLSTALGAKACSESFSKDVADKYMKMADPRKSGKVYQKDFFDFCMNRRYHVRRFLEALGLSTILVPKVETVANEVDCDNTMRVPSGGDEFMANPAWKKTAEKMVPKGAISVPIKPASSLKLEWVHGYRGHDCRNNAVYTDKEGTLMSFHAAGLSIMQTCTESHRTQSYFGEHTDDIIAIAQYPNADYSEVVVATGEIGKQPPIHLYVWKASLGRFEPLSCMRGFHTKGVSQLCFSADGKRLFSVGVDYTVAVYVTDRGSATTFGKMVFSAQGPKGKVLHCCAAGTGGEDFVSCGEKHLQFWKKEKDSYKQEEGKLAAQKSKNIMSCVRGPGAVCIIGTSEGDLLRLAVAGAKDKVTMELQPTGHGLHGDKKNSINALSATALPPTSAPTDNCFVTSGGRDGGVMVWACLPDKLQKCVEFSLPGLPPIRSVCLNATGTKCLMGTQFCEIIEVVHNEGKPFTQLLDASVRYPETALTTTALVNGHFKDELWGLAVRPSLDGKMSDEYCTVGDDGFLRLWSLSLHKQVFSHDMKGLARCCAYSPDGLLIAVGYGGGSTQGKAKEEGLLRVYRIDRTGGYVLTAMSDIKEAKRAISVVRFAPDGATLAAGARDNSIYLYSAAQQFKRKAKFSKHNAGIMMLDFAADGKALQSCCSAYETLYSDTTTGVQIGNAVATLLDTEWASWTCSLGWSVQGVWNGTMDGSDVNAVDRSPSGKLLAVADDFGMVSVYRYPCLQPGAEASVYKGHSSHVTGVKWVQDDLTAGGRAAEKYLISTGGEDKCVFQWLNVTGSDGDLRAALTAAATVAAASAADPGHEEEEGMEGPGGGDEFTAVKPWLGAIVPPTAWSATPPADTDAKAAAFRAALVEFGKEHGHMREKNDAAQERGVHAYDKVRKRARDVFNKMSDSGVSSAAAPDIDEVELEWIHGIRAFDTRNNVRYCQGPKNPKGDLTYKLVYHAAGLGVVYDPFARKQRYFRGHTDDIMSLAVFVNPPVEGKEPQTIVATGQQALAKTYVWDAATMQILAVLETKQKSINMLAFSKDGRLLISIAEDKSVAVSDWKSQRVVATTKGEPAVTHHIAPGVSAAAGSTFLSVGDKHIRMWTLAGQNLTAGKVTMGKNGSPQGFLSCASVGSSFVIGCEDGGLYVLTDGKMCQDRKYDHGTREARKKDAKGSGCSVSSMFADDSRDVLLTGGKDGSVVCWGTTVLKAGGKGADGDSALVKLMHFVLTPRGPTPTPAPAIDISDLMAKQIQSLCLRTDPVGSDKLVIALTTRGCDLLQIDAIKTADGGRVRLDSSKEEGILRGHCNDELWGLATHPTLPQFCTTGDDKTLRFFSITDRKMIQAVPLGSMARACCYSPDGAMLAVGFGGRVGRGKEAGGGLVRVYSVAAFPVIMLCEKNEAKQWISDVKFSSDSRTVAAGAHDNKIYIYDVVVTAGGGGAPVTAGALKLRATFAKHNSVINHLDFSSDGRFMQSNCSAYELLFCDTQTGKQITSATELRDVKWDSWTCTLGWPVQGIWPPGADGSDINAVSRSHSGHLMATSDDFGALKLFRYPCNGSQPAGAKASPAESQAQHLSYAGHSSHVMNVRWSVGDECVITCGGNDKCVMQWRHTIAGSTAPPDGGEEVYDVDEEFLPPAAPAPAEEAEMSGPGGGDESGCVKPWLGAVKTPKNSPSINPAAPAAELELKWVHGYSSGTQGTVRVSNNLFYNVLGELLFPAAALGVKYKQGGAGGVAEQKYFTGHDDDIMCLAMSPCRRYVATGQMASKTSKGKGTVCVWDATDCRLLSRMDGCHQRGVLALAFSPASDKLLTVGQDDKNTHVLFSDLGGNWSRVQPTVTEKGDQNQIAFIRWVHVDSKMVKDAEYHVVSGGASAINFWKLEGATMSKKQGRFGKKKQVPLLCAANLKVKDEWKVVLGTASGDLYLYDEREVTNSVDKAHALAVLCIAEVSVEGGKDVPFIVTGGKDRWVRVWNSALQCVGQMEISPSMSPRDGSVASIDVRPGTAPSGVVLAVGTYGGEVIEIGSESAPGGRKATGMDIASASACTHLHSHFNGELWGLAVHPTDPDIFVTVGDDGTLRVWSISANCQLLNMYLGWPARCVAFHPTGESIAVGFFEKVKGGHGGGKKAAGKGAPAAAAGAGAGDGAGGAHNGSVHVFSFALDAGSVKVEKVAEGCESVAWICDVKFSPNGRLLAAASHDKKLYCYTIPDTPPGAEWAKCLEKNALAFAKFDKHSSAILHVDFSLDGKFMQTDSQSGELLFIDVDKGRQETSATKMAEYNGIVDPEAPLVQWASQTCCLGWPVVGIWPPGADGSDINSADRSVNGKFIATADDFGQVKIFNAPCVKEGAKFKTGDGHSSHVTNVRWTIKDGLVSVGGNDKCAFIWQLNLK